MVYYVVAIPSSYGGRYLAGGYGAVRGNDPGKPITIAGGADVRGVDIALAPSLAIEGRVLDEAGEPLSRMPVFAARLMPGSDTALRLAEVVRWLTDDLGRYRILRPRGWHLSRRRGRAWRRDLRRIVDGARFSSGSQSSREPEPFIVTFHPSARTDSEGQRIRLAAQDVTGIDITLRRARRLQLSGILLDSQGAPASTNGAAGGQTWTRHVRRRQFHANDQGRFVVSGIEPGEYRLLVGAGMATMLASVNGRAEFAEMPLTIVADMPDVIVVTQPGIGLAGKVVFAEGPPASPPKMRIAFRRPETLPPSSREIVATMDDEFRFYGSDGSVRSWCGSPSCQRDGRSKR